MTDNIYSRTEALLGDSAIQKLKNARVAVFGAGGVGSAAIEALVRSGVGNIDIFDHDTISVTNLNRQLMTDSSNIGKSKAEEAAKRAKLINPSVNATAHELFYLPDTADKVDLTQFDYIIDAVDNLTAKLTLVQRSKEAGVQIISSMGTGNKLDITKLKVSDIKKTQTCPLARRMRKELKIRGISDLLCVWSDENPQSVKDTGELKGDRPAPASAVFVPAAAGLLMAKEAVLYICK
jgi:tRNA A37 threonylcarbamoyladenosine dehydratase